MLKKMSIGKKIVGGFGILLFAVGISVVLSIRGIGEIVSNAEEVITGNQLRGMLVQKEVDHLNWVEQLNALLTDESVTELNVETDPHKCGFGTWFYSDKRTRAVELVPELKPLFDSIEEPHKQLHQSAIAIDDVFVQADVSLPKFFAEKERDHLAWTNQVLLYLEGSIESLDIQLDDHKCGLGKFIYGEKGRHLAESDPQFARLISEIKEPHNKLHQSAIGIREADTDGQARRVFQTETLPALRATQDVLFPMKKRAENLVSNMEKSKDIYAGKTKPALRQVQTLLHELEDNASEHIMTDKYLLASARTTRSSVILIGIVVFGLGALIAFFITRIITKPIRRIIDGLTSGAEQLTAASSQVSQASQELASGSSEQASSIEETSASLEEMDSMTKQNRDGAKKANQMATEANRLAENGNEKMGQMMAAINDVSESADETSKIIKTIDEIAFQTNLLALNAAVEAARAGEAGQGFAVVADEVRNLAQRAAEAAKTTAELIEGSKTNAEKSVAIVKEVDAFLTDINDQSGKVNELVGEIAAASDEQTTGIEQINVAISQVDQVTQNVAANAEESASAAEELSSQAEVLMQSVVEMQAMIEGQSESQGAFGTHPNSNGSAPGRNKKSEPKTTPEKNENKTSENSEEMAEDMIPFGDDNGASNGFEDF